LIRRTKSKIVTDFFHIWLLLTSFIFYPPFYPLLIGVINISALTTAPTSLLKKTNTMKNKLLVVCMIIGLLATTNSSFSKTYKTPTYESVIDDYIDSYMTSNFKKLDKVLSDDVRVKMPRAEKVIVQYKADLLERMKADATKQDCTSEYEVIAKSDAIIIARVDFQYANFKQQNYITMEKNDNNEWKITQVCRIFKNNDATGPSPSVASLTH